jgi:hypothetical protein
VMYICRAVMYICRTVMYICRTVKCQYFGPIIIKYGQIDNFNDKMAISALHVQLPDTRYQLPATRFQIPDTSYQLPHRQKTTYVKLLEDKGGRIILVRGLSVVNICKWKQELIKTK